jgi:hypothetical protein
MSLALFSVVSLQANALDGLTTVDGYIRGTYHNHDIEKDKVYKDDAVGGKLHIETLSMAGISLGASVYASFTMFNDDNRGLIRLRGERHRSYSILGEMYLKSEFDKNILTLGRQELETPFAQMDDVGMIPNTFEAVTLLNNEMENTTLFLGQIQKMSGVDAEVIDEFSKVNGSKNMQILGLSYDGISDLAFSAWYYRLSGAEVDEISYVEATYEKKLGDYLYAWGLQYSKQGHSTKRATSILGAKLSLIAKEMGLTFSTAYNKTKEGSAFSGFGGGPFFSNSEYLILDNAGDNAQAKWMGIELDASVLGLRGLNMGIGKITLETEASQEASEIDFIASYVINNEMEMHMIYSNLKGASIGEDEAKHLRIYANYNF